MIRTWTVVPNPAWAGVEPSGFTESACHDLSHFVGITCCCGEQMHVHETQIDGQEAAMMGAACKGCGELLMFEPGELHGMFAELRNQGWIR
jgi:hypothetical protein